MPQIRDLQYFTEQALRVFHDSSRRLAVGVLDAEHAAIWIDHIVRRERLQSPQMPFRFQVALVAIEQVAVDGGGRSLARHQDGGRMVARSAAAKCVVQEAESDAHHLAQGAAGGAIAARERDERRADAIGIEHDACVRDPGGESIGQVSACLIEPVERPPAAGEASVR